MSTVITTFSKDGYELYGHKMIETWIKYWPEEFKLIVYTEGFNLKEKDSRITEIDINIACPELSDFKEKSKALTDQKQTRIEKTIKWCHKVYAIRHALSVDDDYLIFLDGDTYTSNIVNIKMPSQIVEDNLFAVHFENLKDGLHFETGFIVFNLKHPLTKWLESIVTSSYDNLTIYSMKKSWDGYWFAQLYKEHNLPVKDLAENCFGVFCNPLIKNILHHDVGTIKYSRANYNKFTGKKQ
jgi:hypothetical protein